MMRRLILLPIIIAAFVIASTEAAATLENLTISGPDTVKQLEAAYFGVSVDGNPNLYTIEWSCEPETAGWFTTPQQAGTAFVASSLERVNSLDAVISVSITSPDGESVTLQKNLTIQSGLSAESWSISIDDSLYVQDVAIDGSDNIYLIGGIDSRTDFDPGPGQDICSNQGYDSDFLTSYDSSGNYRWTVMIDQQEQGQEWMHSVFVTSAGEIIVMGQAGPELHIDRGDRRWDLTGSESYDSGHALRFNSDGDFLGYVHFWEYSEFVRGGIYDVNCMCEDAEGNYYFAGAFSGQLDFDPGPGQTISPFPYGMFVVKMDSGFNTIWAKIIGCADSIVGDISDMALMPDGNLIAGGYHIYQLTFSTPSEYRDNVTITTGEDGWFIAVFNSDGDLVMNRLGPGPPAFGGLNLKGLEVDSSGDILAYGVATDTDDLDPGEGEYFIEGNETWSPFFVKWPPTLDSVEPMDNFPPISDFIHAGSGDYYAAGMIIGNYDLDPGPGVENVSLPRMSAYVIRLVEDFNLIKHWIVPYEAGNEPIIAVSGDGNVALAMGSTSPLLVYLGQ